MRILGIDPGTAITGFAVIDTQNSQVIVRDIGCITTKSANGMPACLREIAENLEEILEKWQPDYAAVEKLYFSQNVTTAVTVAQARGVIIETIHSHGVQIAEYLPRQIKLAVCGDGGADKKAVQKMMQLITHLPSLPKKDDATDALAVAICHANTLPLLASIA